MSVIADYTATVRVPLPDPEAARATFEAATGASFDPDEILNVVQMLSGTEGMFAGVAGLVQKIFGPDGIDHPKNRQVIVLRVAIALGAPYEWQANAAIARNVGLTDDEIAATAVDGPVTGGLDPEQVLLCAAVDELIGDHTLTDATLAALLERYGAVLTRKYLLSIGFFTCIGLFLNGTRVPLETTDKIGDRTSPIG
jgi:alkylhydroperoxidase family enzyme